jgi:ABC-2 type transport system permease protein
VLGVSIVLHGSVMFTTNGLYLMLNSLIFMICALSVGFLTGNIFTNENAIAAVVNIVALGTSFICGSFLPTSFLPDWVAKMSKIFPSYWYIHNTDLISSIETFNFDTLLPVFQGMGIVLSFAFIYFIIAIIYNSIRVKN